MRISIRNLRGKVESDVCWGVCEYDDRENRPTAIGTVGYVSLYVCMYVKKRWRKEKDGIGKIN